jgi:hypothetical protein
MTDTFEDRFMLSKGMQPKYEEIYKIWGWHDFNRSMELGHLDKEYHLDMTARDKNECLVGVQEKDHSHEFMERYLTFTVNLRQQHILRSEFFESLAAYHVCGYQSADGGVDALLCCNMIKFREFVFDNITIDDIRSGGHRWVETGGREWFLRVPFSKLVMDGIPEYEYFTARGQEVLDSKISYRKMAKEVK